MGMCFVYFSFYITAYIRKRNKIEINKNMYIYIFFFNNNVKS